MSAAQVIEAFQAVLDAAPSERDGILMDLQRRDPPVADQCRRLLAALDEAESRSFLESPTPSLAALRRAIPLRARAAALPRADRPPPPPPGYTLDRCIGHGGFGQVWIAQNTVTNTFHAVKFAPASGSLELDGLRRLTNAVADRPGLVAIEHVGTEGDWLYAIMPLADSAESSGPVQSPASYRPLTLRTYAARSLRHDAAEVAAIGAEIASGLSTLHDAGLAHGDVKPENILRFQGRWRLGDYSVVHPVDSISPGGTPEYFPPEGGGGVGADQFALAATLRWLATGHSPASSQAWLDQVPPSGQRAATGLDRVLRRAASPDPRNRFSTVGEMAAALRRINRGRAPLPQAARVALVTVVCGLVAVGAALIWAPRRGEPDRTGAVEPGASERDLAVAPADIVETKVTFGTIEHALDEHGSISSAFGRFGDLPVLVCGRDHFALTVELVQPAYTVALYLRPDGSMVLCVPNGDDVHPELARRLVFPSHAGNSWYEMTALDGAGQAGVLVISSQQPLPPLNSWPVGDRLREAWSAPARDGEPAASWWRFDGLRVSPIRSDTRNVSEPRAPGTLRPARVDLVMSAIEPLIDAGVDVHALFFPITSGP